MPSPNTLTANTMRHILKAMDAAITTIGAAPTAVRLANGCAIAGALGQLTFARRELISAALADVAVEQAEPV